MRQIVYFTTFILLFVILNQSCYKERLHLDKVKAGSWDAQWAIPIANAELSLKGILGDSTGIIHTDNDGFISLVYESQHLIQLHADEYLHLDDISSDESVEFDLPPIPDGITIDLPPIEMNIPLEVAGKRIDSLILNDGLLTIALTTNLNKNTASLELEIPSLRNANNEALVLLFDLSNAGNESITIQKEQDLENYRIVTIEEDDTQKLQLALKATVTGDSKPNNSPYSFDIDFQFSAMDLHAFYGYFGAETLPFQDTIQLGIFGATELGGISFADNSLHFSLTADNSFGIPLQLDIVESKAYHLSPPEQEVPIYFLGEGNPQVIDILSPSFAEIGQTKHTNISATTSNISNAIAISPQQICLGIEGNVNPDGDPDALNFILEDSYFSADFRVQMDMFGQINGFVLVDTIPLKDRLFDNLKDLELTFDILNGFPLEASLEIFFLDSTNTSWYTVGEADELFVEGATVSGAPDYRVVEEAHKLSSLAFGDTITGNLSTFKNLVVKSKLSTTNSDLVKVYDDYQIKVKVGAKFKTSIN
jgi:hypothetical protein